MWPGFKSRRRRHMWVEFVVGSLLCSERFFSGYSGFPLSSKTSISKFQFDQESGRRRATLWMCYLQIITKSAILNQLNVFHFQHIEVIELFTDTAAILNLLDLRSIRGHSVSIYARFSGKKRTSMHTSWEKGDHYYIQTRHNDLFSHYNLFLGKLKKLARKARVNTDASVSDRPRAPWASHNTPYYSFKIFPKF